MLANLLRRGSQGEEHNEVTSLGCYGRRSKTTNSGGLETCLKVDYVDYDRDTSGTTSLKQERGERAGDRD